MKNDLTTKRTSLSHSIDVRSTLEWKMQSLQENDLPVQEGIADYIGLALDEIALKENQLKQVKQEIAERQKELSEQKESIKSGSVSFFEQYGIEKLEGNIISSITIIKAKDAGTKKVFKTELSKKEIEDFLIESGLGFYEEEPTEATSASIRVNKRKIALSEVVDA